MATREQRSAQRLLRRHGALLLFREYAETKNRKAGTQSWAVTGTEVTARAAVLPLRVSEDADIQTGDYAMRVDATPFADHLTTSWRVEISGDEYQISGPVLASRSNPTAPPAYYLARLRLGEKTLGL